MTVAKINDGCEDRSDRRGSNGHDKEEDSTVASTVATVDGDTLVEDRGDTVVVEMTVAVATTMIISLCRRRRCWVHFVSVKKLL